MFTYCPFSFPIVLTTPALLTSASLFACGLRGALERSTLTSYLSLPARCWYAAQKKKKTDESKIHIRKERERHAHRD